MGRKQTSKKKYSKNSRKSKKNLSTDMLGGFLVVVGFVFFILLAFDSMGAFSIFLKSLLFGIFGKAAFLIPLTMCIVGIYAIMSDSQVVVSKELKKGILIVLLVAPLIYSFSSSNYDMFTNVVKYAVDSFNEGVGGTVGALICGVAVKLIGITPTKVLFSMLTFVAILCVFNISFAQFFKIIKNIVIGLKDGLISVVEILFRNDTESEKKSRKNDNLEETISQAEFDELKEVQMPKKSRKASNINIELDDEPEVSEEIKEKMQEKGSPNPEQSLKYDRTEQVEFDFNKLGGKPSEQEVQAKQQRDEFFKKQKEEKEDKSIKEVLTLDHTNHVIEDNYEFPPVELLNMPVHSQESDKKSIHATAVKLQKTLLSFGVEARVTNITKGPTVTRYELTPSIGVKVSKIVNLADDIALNLAAKSIRIEAPIPGKAAVGIEVPNPVSESVYLREIIESQEFNNHKSKVAFGLGKDAAGDIVIADIAKMPHTLVAGQTGSGKSVCINSILVSILYKAKPSEVKLILIDPKMVELSGYNGIPHLLIPVVTDPKKAAGTLNWAVQEMVNRYNLFAASGVKDIKGYNKLIEKEEGQAKLPQIVIIIDELADLMMVAQNDVEDAICRLAQMARAAGMHLIIATQRPSVDVITGIIKANIPSRIAFTVSSQVDSRTILDMAGAEKLLGKGDMLYYPTGETKPLRVQGAFVSEEEIERIVEHIKSTTDANYSEDILDKIEKANCGGTKGSKESGIDSQDDDSDVLLNDAIDIVVDLGSASASLLQRKLKVGYSRAGRMIDQMEERGLISKSDGSKARNVLISKSEWQELKMGKKNSNEEQFEKNEVVNENVVRPIIEDTVVTCPVETSEVDVTTKNVATPVQNSGGVNVYYGNQLSTRDRKIFDVESGVSKSKYNVDL